MKTKNNLNYIIKDGICELLIPRYESQFSSLVQEAKKEIYANENLPDFKAIITKKMDYLKIEL